MIRAGWTAAGRRDAPGASHVIRDGTWLVSGPGVGGPNALPPGTGVLNLAIACEQPVTVPDDAGQMTVVVTFGPDCSIEAAAAVR
jgi:hypothetical protein